MSELGQMRRIDKLPTLAACLLCIRQRPNWCITAKRREVPIAS
jgi:hypothetical protein